MGTIVTIGENRLRSAGRLQHADRRPRLLRVLLACMSWVDAKLERRRTRRGLLELSDYELKDIGLSRCDAEREAQRRFWD